MRSRQRSNLTMTNIKILMAFVSGWFMCSLVTPRFWHPLSSDTMPLSRATSRSNSNITHCETKVDRPPNLMQISATIPESPPAAKPQPMDESAANALPLPPRTSSRCEFLWDPASGCRRPPFKAFDTSRRANTSCFGRFNGQPPPVVRHLGSYMLGQPLVLVHGGRRRRSFTVCVCLNFSFRWPSRPSHALAAHS